MIKRWWLLLFVPCGLRSSIFSALGELNAHNRAAAFTLFQYAQTNAASSSPRPVPRTQMICSLQEIKGLPESIYRMNADNLPRTMIFFGPSGTGKTMAAYAVAHELNYEITKVSGSQFFNQFIGESQRNIEKLFAQIRSSGKKTILLVEDIDALVGLRAMKEHPEYRGAADRFMDELASPHNPTLYLIGTTKHIEEISASFKEKGGLDHEFIEFNLPKPDDRAAIMRSALQNRNYVPSAELLQSLVHITHHMTPQDMVSVLNKVSAAELNTEALLKSLHAKRQEKNEAAKRHAMEHEAFFAQPVDPKVTFNDLGGAIPVEVFNLLQKFRFPQSCIQIIGDSGAGGLLLYGPPGTGKTLLAQAFAGQAQAKFVYVPATSISDEMVGSGAKRIESIFRQVKQYVEHNPNEKIVVCIDEIDAVGKRTQGEHAEYGNTLNALKIALTDIAAYTSVLVIAATNNKELLDPALIRSGRFNTQVMVPLPNFENRRMILQHYLNKVPHAITATDLPGYVDLLAQQTDGCNCADLQSIILDKACTFANLAQSQAISQHHIDQGLAEVRKLYFARLKQEMPYRMDFDPRLGLENILGIPKEVTDYLSDLKAYARSPHEAPRGLLLYGPPGTGKTTMAKSISQASGFDCVFLVAPQLFNLVEGPESVSKLFLQLRSTNRPTVLVVDEIDKIGSKQTIETVPGAASVATIFWNELSNPLNAMIFVIATTNKPEQLEEALVRTGRFDHKVGIDLPDNNLRGDLIDFYLRPHGLEIGFEQRSELVKLSKNFSGQDIKTCIMHARRDCKRGEEQAAMMRRLRAIVETEQKARIEEARRLLKEHAPFTISDATISLKDIAGTVDKDIAQLMRHFKAGVNEFGQKPQQGLLLYGPPGTGKSMLAHVFAGETGAKLISISAGSFANKYIGEGPQSIRNMFAVAKSYAQQDGKIVIFIDEFDAVAMQRRHNDNGEEIRMVSELLTGLSDLESLSDKIFVIAASNNFKDLDEAIIRAGRFGTKKEIKLPSDQDRAAILKHYLDPLQTFHNLYRADLSAEQCLNLISCWPIVRDTNDFAHSDVHALVDVALRVASGANSKELTAEHLAVAVKEVRNDIIQRKDRNKTMQEKQLAESVKSREQAEKQFAESQQKTTKQTYAQNAMVGAGIGVSIATATAKGAAGGAAFGPFGVAIGAATGLVGGLVITRALG